MARQQKKFKKKFYITSTKEIENSEILIQEYLKEKIKISINKKAQNIKYLAREVEGDVLIFLHQNCDFKKNKYLRNL